MTAPQRRFFQIHLSTAVILSLEVGVLLFLSLPSSSKRIWSPDPRMRDDTVIRQEWGWPVQSIVIDTPAGPPRPDEYVGGYETPRTQAGAFGVVADALISLVILGYTAAFSEHRISGKVNVEIKRLWFRRHLFTIIIVALLCTLPTLNPEDRNLWLGNTALIVVCTAFELCLLQNITGPELF
jgi:hypothetical protein